VLWATGWQALQPPCERTAAVCFPSAGDRPNPAGAAKAPSALADAAEDDNTDGTLLIDVFSRLRFARDLRLGEIRRLLRSSVLGSLRLPERPEVTDHDVVQLEQQARKLRRPRRSRLV
jgi:hypothetical protein